MHSENATDGTGSRTLPTGPVTMERLNTLGHMMWAAFVDDDVERATRIAYRFRSLLFVLMDQQVSDEALETNALSCAELQLDLDLLLHAKWIVVASTRCDPACTRIAATLTALTGLHCQRYPRAAVERTEQSPRMPT